MIFGQLVVRGIVEEVFWVIGFFSRVMWHNCVSRRQKAIQRCRMYHVRSRGLNLCPQARGSGQRPLCFAETCYLLMLINQSKED